MISTVWSIIGSLAYRPIICLKKNKHQQEGTKRASSCVLNPPLTMVYKYSHDLLSTYLALDQGEKIQAECSQTPHLFYFSF